MADARALLRQQRAARQQALPQTKPTAVPTAKKRKAGADGSVADSKRTRTETQLGVPAGFFDADATSEEVLAEEPTDVPTEVPANAVLESAMTQATVPPTAENPQLDAAAAAELDAFLSEMSRDKPASAPSASYARAVVEAAPMTTAEIAAQARLEQDAQRAKKDEEIEGDQEDAARALEDEFEEMESLEERVQRLRDQREALRIRPTPPPPPPVPQNDTGDSGLDDDDGNENNDDEDDWDDWRFRPA